MAKIVFFGVSNMLSDVFDCALALGHQITRVVRNQPEVLRDRTKPATARIGALPGPADLIDIADFRPEAGEIYALGTTSPGRAALVAELATRFGITCATLVHPRAYVSPLARLEAGVFVGALSVVGPGATLETHVFVNRGVTIGHDTTVGAYARLQPGCNVAGHIHIGAFTTIGMGACVIEEREIGARATVGAGAVVVRDVAEGAKVMGVPARVVGTTH